MTPMQEIKAVRVFQHYVDGLDRYLNAHYAEARNLTSVRPLSNAEHEFLRRIEDCIDIPEQGADDFRRQVVAYFWHLEYNGKNVTWDCNPHVKKAVCKFLDENPDEVIPEFVQTFGKRFRTIDESWEPSD